jgi:hypothetical protein
MDRPMSVAGLGMPIMIGMESQTPGAASRITSRRLPVVVRIGFPTNRNNSSRLPIGMFIETRFCGLGGKHSFLSFFPSQHGG